MSADERPARAHPTSPQGGSGPSGRAPRRERMLRVLLPIAVLALGVVLWDAVVRYYAIPPYVLPGPWLIFSTLVSDWGVLSASLVVTLTTTLKALRLRWSAGSPLRSCSISRA